MNRKILAFLIIIAVALYSYIAFLIAGGSFSSPVKTIKTEKNKKLSVDEMVLNTVPVKFKDSKRDPFLPFKKEPVKDTTTTVKKTVKNIPKKEPPKPLSITITGIMWNPSSPVAMVKMPDGASTVAKPGTVIGNIRFKKIEKGRILVSSEGKDFWIDR